MHTKQSFAAEGMMPYGIMLRGDGEQPDSADAQATTITFTYQLMVFNRLVAAAAPHVTLSTCMHYDWQQQAASLPFHQYALPGPDCSISKLQVIDLAWSH